MSLAVGCELIGRERMYCVAGLQQLWAVSSLLKNPLRGSILQAVHGRPYFCTACPDNVNTLQGGKYSIFHFDQVCLFVAVPASTLPCLLRLQPALLAFAKNWHRLVLVLGSNCRTSSSVDYLYTHIIIYKYMYIYILLYIYI